MRLISIILVLLLASVAFSQPTADGQFVVVTNNGTTFGVKIQLKASAATGLGSSTLQFTYRATDLSFPALPVAGTDYTYHNFFGGDYSFSTVTRPLTSTVSVNIVYNGADNAGTLVNTTFTDVITINFSTLNSSGSSDLQWSLIELFDDNGSTPWINGSFPNLNTTPLPITLSSFTGQVLQNGTIRLDWTTLSEIENYGFNVERKRSSEQTFVELPNSFIQGHGTTNEPHQYTFTDTTTTAGTWQYRLKQIDMDGTVHHTDPVQVDMLTDVKEKEIPTVFSLSPNYPNPWNPSTTIRYGLPQASLVTLTVFNMLGQQVVQLVNGQQEAGYHNAVFRGDELASGVYLYCLQAGDFVQTKRMILLR